MGQAGHWDEEWGAQVPPPGTPDPLERNAIAQCFDGSGAIARATDLGALVVVGAAAVGNGSAALVIKRRMAGSGDIAYEHVRLDRELRLGRPVRLLEERASWVRVTWANHAGQPRGEASRYVHPGQVHVGTEDLRSGYSGRFMSPSATDSFVMLTRAPLRAPARVDVLCIDEVTGTVSVVRPIRNGVDVHGGGPQRAVATSLHRPATGTPLVLLELRYPGHAAVVNVRAWQNPHQDLEALPLVGDPSRDTWFPIVGSRLRLGTNSVISMLAPER